MLHCTVVCSIVFNTVCVAVLLAGGVAVTGNNNKPCRDTATGHYAPAEIRQQNR